jgi:hypothetical protein
MMKLTRDEELEYQSYGSHRSRCRFRIYRDGDLSIAIVSDLGSKNLGPSLTNSIEDAARYCLQNLELPAEGFTLFEHLVTPEGETFDLVTVPEGWTRFAKSSRFVVGHSTDPVWVPQAQSVVEQLIGGTL